MALWMIVKGIESRWDREFWHKDHGFTRDWGVTRFTDDERKAFTQTLEEGAEWHEAPTVHTFESSGDAYDACQTDPMIATGDTLVIESEHCVGLAWAWPTAITPFAGKLHTTKEGEFANVMIEEGFSKEQVAAAIKEAVRLKCPLLDEAYEFAKELLS